MNTLLSLIYKNHIIRVYIPEIDKKKNLYYTPSDKLHEFDEVIVTYEYLDKNVILSIDIIREVLLKMTTMLEQSLQDKLVLPNKIKKGELGKSWNIDTYSLLKNKIEEYEKDDVFEQHWLYSYKQIQTWIYNCDSEICVEVSPSYEWFFKESGEHVDHLDFEAFLVSYKPLAFFCIDKKTAAGWKKQCDSLVKNIGIIQ